MHVEQLIKISCCVTNSPDVIYVSQLTTANQFAYDHVSSAFIITIFPITYIFYVICVDLSCIEYAQLTCDQEQTIRATRRKQPDINWSDELGSFLWSLPLTKISFYRAPLTSRIFPWFTDERHKNWFYAWMHAFLCALMRPAPHITVFVNFLSLPL